MQLAHDKGIRIALTARWATLQVDFRAQASSQAARIAGSNDLSEIERIEDAADCVRKQTSINNVLQLS